MNFKTALEIAKDCDLETVGEAIYNIRLRIGQIIEVHEYYSLLEEVSKLGASNEELVEDWLVKL